jgi:hypothetical protein
VTRVHLVGGVVVLVVVGQEGFQVALGDDPVAHLELLVDGILAACLRRLNHLELNAISEGEKRMSSINRNNLHNTRE